jgi:hypothetical protein
MNGRAASHSHAPVAGSGVAGAGGLEPTTGDYESSTSRARTELQYQGAETAPVGVPRLTSAYGRIGNKSASPNSYAFRIICDTPYLPPIPPVRPE